jgi:hypothetical protein
MLRRHTGVTNFDTFASTLVRSPLWVFRRSQKAMLRYPVTTIFALVFLSMSLAVLFHFWQNNLTLRAPAFTNESETLLDSDPLFSPEEKESCVHERLKYQKTFELMPVFLRERRSSAPTDFPRSCLIYIMKKRMQKWKPVDKKCAPGSPACLTEEYINVVYNAYGDVFNCMNIPQKELLPKFMSENGLHLNQFLNVMGFQKNEALIEKYKQEVIDSEEPACRRIANLIKGFKVDLQSDCALMTPPENPVLSFFLFAAFYKEVEKQILVEDDKIKQFLTFQALSEKPEKVMQTYQRYLREKKAEQSYQDFLSHHERASHEQFLRLLKSVQELDKAFKEGTCVSESFLAL